ncbi:UNVERIFIED_CONTAM: hypothetical protein Sradi_6075600 [Sesamum radiatum]|uniref:Uncharacterized protein n=1 Tax=Sesamum radiatum TaxID=300843 RepID=A0AAW2KJE1_SESRA
MDPQYEQRLRDDVIYLHSLWHQGPPTATESASSTAVRHQLQPAKATQFKKEKKRRGKSGKNSTKKPNNAAPESKSSPGPEWPCPTPPSPDSATGWPSLEAKSDAKTLSLSSEEQSKLAAKHAHQHAVKVVHEFFMSNRADDSDGIDSSSDEDDELMEEDDGRKEYNFFFKVFKEDAGLREYYENNFAKGEFSCLVCGALGGKKTGKKYKGCLPLVQHSITIAKTKKKKAHRAFGQAVCKVLGWDIDQLPAIVSLLSDKSSETLGNVNSENKDSSTNIVNNIDSIVGNNGEGVSESGSIATGTLPNSEEGDMNSMMCPDAGKNSEDIGMVHLHDAEEPAAEGLSQDSLTCPDADKNLENLGVVHPHNMEEPAAQGLTSVPLDGNNGDGNEMQDLQMGNGVLHGNNGDGNEMQDLQMGNRALDSPDGVGNEMQDPQMGNGVLGGPKEDNEIKT